jgi:RNAse (barnase) inhibitor barstar
MPNLASSGRWAKTQGMWPFDQPPNCATMTSQQVIRGCEPITHAYHDESDHGWQFFSAAGATTADAMVVTLEEIVKVDRTILEIADLPPGWMAERKSLGAPWTRKLQYADAASIVVDWSRIASEEDFYDTVLSQCGSPSWHGRNLDALADSWVTGGIDRLGPPYAFEFLNADSTRSDLIPFRDAVFRICEESIEENGGRRIHQAEQVSASDGGEPSN